MNTLKKSIITSILFFCTLNSVQTWADTSQKEEASFQIWLDNFKVNASAQGISDETLNRAFKGITLNEKVLELDRRQPEFSSTFWQYFNRAVTEWRVKKGQELLQKNQALLTEVTKKYGVPERILVAFWGMETNYGSYTGNTPTIQALATLAYDPRRRTFFSHELISALKVIEKGYVTPTKMQGSWAGAVGQCQFMPSNYLRYAVDGDGDGKKDLWHSQADIFHSMGNFLQQLGWEKEVNWGREVKLPKHFNLAMADGKQQRSLDEWRKLGIKLADGREIPHSEMPIQAALLLPYDYRGPAFLVYHNFFVIKKWNNSTNYALAVGHLADRLIGRAPLSKKQPKNDKAMTREQVKELQERLTFEGYNVGKPDGVAGSKTRTGLRAYQAKKGLPIDGYPSVRMLTILQQNQH